MPKYDDHFSGHLEHGDPRTPVTAAGACLWPTMPAHRFLLGSQDASGIFGGFNVWGGLFEKSSPGPAHDLCQWSSLSLPPGWLIGIAIKAIRPDRGAFVWTVTLNHAIFGLAIKSVEFDRSNCNRDFLIGDFGVLNPAVGRTGLSCTLYQVEFDHTEPPGGFP